VVKASHALTGTQLLGEKPDQEKSQSVCKRFMARRIDHGGTKRKFEYTSPWLRPRLFFVVIEKGSLTSVRYAQQDIQAL